MFHAEPCCRVVSLVVYFCWLQIRATAKFAAGTLWALLLVLLPNCSQDVKTQWYFQCFFWGREGSASWKESQNGEQAEYVSLTLPSRRILRVRNSASLNKRQCCQNEGLFLPCPCGCSQFCSPSGCFSLVPELWVTHKDILGFFYSSSWILWRRVELEILALC